MVSERSGELSAKRRKRIVNARLGARLSCQRRDSFDIPCHGDQLPLPLHPRQAAQQELPEAHHRLDDAEHRFHGLLAQAIELAPPSRLETMLHPLHRAGRLGQWGRLGESVLPVRVMSVAPCRKQRLDLRRYATLDVRRAEVPVVGQQMLHAAQCLGQAGKHFEHRLELLLVGGHLRDVGRHTSIVSVSTAACAL